MELILVALLTKLLDLNTILRQEQMYEYFDRYFYFFFLCK
jgi:hypothetical protein